MWLKTVHLHNYRAHADLCIKFSAHFNVVVGVNGSGKTSLLRGICEVLHGTFWGDNTVTNVLFSDSGAEHLSITADKGRYRFEAQHPVTIETSADVFGRTYNWSVTKSNASNREGSINGIPPAADLKVRTANPHVGSPGYWKALPIVVFYRANRQWVTSHTSELKAASKKDSRREGYTQWWDAALSATALQNWAIAKCLERYQRSSETGILFNDIHDDELALVNGALATVMENARGLRYDMPRKSLLVDWSAPDGTSLEPIMFEHLSDGQRAVCGLVADIARRMCLLNPHLGKEVISETPGVVLIDELDVHLHPKWQRIVTNGLKAAFPAVQFIVTSHSPQVLGELHPEEIILLRPGGTEHPQVSYGLDSSQVLEEIMGAPSRNEEVETKVNELFATIERNQLDDAKNLLAELKNMAPHIPELGGAEALIRRKEVIGR